MSTFSTDHGLFEELGNTLILWKRGRNIRPYHNTDQYPRGTGSRRAGMKIAHMRIWPMVALRWSPMSTTISVHFNIFV